MGMQCFMFHVFQPILNIGLDGEIWKLFLMLAVIQLIVEL